MVAKTINLASFSRRYGSAKFQGIRNTVNEYLISFGCYDWLWRDDKDEAYDRFMSKNPSLDDYEAKLKTFSVTEDEIGEISWVPL